MSIQVIPIIQLTREAGGPCTHSALRSTGKDQWECVLCGAALTGLDLINQRNARRKPAQAQPQPGKAAPQ